jgi:serpin B
MSGSSSMVKYRALGALAMAGMVAAACGSAIATPASGLGSSASPHVAFASPFWSPRPTLSRQPYESFALGDFTVIRGLNQDVTPARDWGTAVAGELNDFGFDLLRHLDSSGNLCASPTSIALALAMVEPGAKGPTAAEMATVLHSFGTAGEANEILALIDGLRRHTAYADENGGLLVPGVVPAASADPVVELTLANQAFLQKNMAFEPDYLDALRSSFDSGLGVLDFKADPEAARLAVNKWAGDQTKGRIPSVLQPGDLDIYTRFALVNSIYLKAPWEAPFSAADTKSRDFTTATGSVVSVPTMWTGRNMAYVAGPDYRAAELRLVGNMSMTVIVPDDMARFEAGLSQARLADLLKAESTYDVDFTMPKFSIDTRFDLRTALITMGMPLAFSDTADLSGIAPRGEFDPLGLKLDKVIHQANIDVVEEGTTASAVTVVIGRAVTGGEMETPPHAQFNVDRPFLYLIRDNASGAVLFMGRVDDPSI